MISGINVASSSACDPLLNDIGYMTCMDPVAVQKLSADRLHCGRVVGCRPTIRNWGSKGQSLVCLSLSP